MYAGIVQEGISRPSITKKGNVDYVHESQIHCIHLADMPFLHDFTIDMDRNSGAGAEHYVSSC